MPFTRLTAPRYRLCLSLAHELAALILGVVSWRCQQGKPVAIFVPVRPFAALLFAA